VAADAVEDEDADGLPYPFDRHRPERAQGERTPRPYPTGAFN